MRTSYSYAQKGWFNPAARKNMWPSLMSVLAFVIPAIMFFEIKAIGRLFGSDMLCLGLFPILLFTKGGLLKNSFARAFIWLGLLYFLGQFTTDLVLETPYYDYSRGWAKIVVTVISFCTLFMIIGLNRGRILIFALGIVTGEILQFYFNPGVYATGHPWKFGVGVAIVWLLIIFAVLLKNKKVIIIEARYFLPFLAGALNLYFGFRSLAGICFLTLAYLSLQRLLQVRPGKDARLPTKKIVLMAIGLFAAAIMIVEFYEFSAREGWLGQVQKQKYEAQAHGVYGLFLGGRSEILVASRAIWESPLLGHGSWAKDWKYAEMLIALKRQLGYDPGSIHELGLIPTHSHLFGAWVEAGLLGAIFWGWVLSLPVRASIRLFSADDPHTPLLVFIALLLTWDILFSPFGATRRLLIPFYAICMIDVVTRYPVRPRKT
ncbi:MAG TPA: hypothetical protein ENF28_01600 [Proteobacteria bacterium]|nr:hypothetical protein [Pseudomonadota bacterium]